MGWQDDPVVAQGAQQPAWMADPVVGSEAAEPPPQESSFVQDLGRAAAMQGGALVKGAAGLVALPSDAVVRLLNAVGITDWKPAAESINEAIDSVVPQPRNATERVTNSVVGSLGGAAGGIGLGRALAGATGAALAANPGAQAAGAVTGGASSQLAAEAGAGPGVQLAAGLAGGMAGAGAQVGAAGATRRAFRGGEAGRQTVEGNVKAFEDAGTSPTVGQATERRSMQAAESLLSKTPGSAGRMAQKAEEEAAQLGAGVERQAGKLSPKASAEQAGRAIERGVRGEGGFVEQFKAKQSELYNELDRYVQPQTGVELSNTTRSLAALNAPIKGAENTSKFFQNAKMRSIEEALKKDLGESGTTPPIEDLESVLATGGALPYEAVKKLRTLVGNEMADSTILSDVPRSKWKALYGALSADLEGAAKNAGTGATAAWSRANTYTRAGMRRLEQIDHVVEKNGGPEAVFAAATSGTKEGATTLRAVMQSLPKEGQRTVSATVLRRLGRATSGKQDDLGEKFSTETFLTNWNGMSPAAKAVLFDRYGPEFRQSMDQIAKVTSNLRAGSKVFQNPSGTGQALAQTTTAATFALSVITGNLPAAGGIAAGVTLSNLSARLMTNPRFVRWLAQSTKAPAAAAPALLNQLAQYDDPEIREFVALAKDQQPQDNQDANRRQ